MSAAMTADASRAGGQSSLASAALRLRSAPTTRGHTSRLVFRKAIYSIVLTKIRSCGLGVSL